MWILIAGFAFAVRLAFVLGVPQTPVVSDSQVYDLAGEAAASWMGPRLPELLSGVAQWRTDVLRDFAGDLSWLVLAKGPVYPMFLGFIYLIAGHHYLAVRLAQVILDTLTVLLVGGLGGRMHGSKCGLIAAALYATYLPTIFMAGRVMQETLIMFLLAGLLWLLSRGIEPKDTTRRGPLLLIGAVLGTILIGKPSCQYLFVLLVPALLLAQPTTPKQKLRAGASMMGGVLIPVGPMMLLLGLLFGRVSINGALAPSYERDLFFGLHPCSQGWGPDIPQAPKVNLPPASFDIPDTKEGQTYSQAIGSYLRRHPLVPLQMGLRKAYHLYALPSAEWQEHYLLPWPVFVVWHKTLVILGLLGMACSVSQWRRALPLLAVVIYVLGVALTVQTQARLALPALVAWAPLAALGLVRLGEILAKRSPRNSLWWGLLLTGCIALLALPVLEVASLISLAPLLDPRSALYAGWFLRALLLALILFSLDRSLITGPDRLSRCVIGILALFGALVVGTHDLDGGNWREWRATLRSPDSRIEQTFRLVEQGPGAIQDGRLLVDVAPQLAPSDVVRVQLGGEAPILLHGDELGGDCLRDYFAEANSRWQGGYSLLQEYGTFDLSRMRQWLEVPVPRSILAGESFRVTLDLPHGGRLGVFGDFASDPPDEFETPTLQACHLSIRTSFWKFLNDHDYRVHEKVRLKREVNGTWWKGSRRDLHDLAPEPGLQTGHYRIFLIIRRTDGTQVVL